MNIWNIFSICILLAAVVLGAKARKRNPWSATRGHRFNQQKDDAAASGPNQCPVICRGQAGINGIPGLDGEDGTPGLPGNPGQKGEPGRPAKTFIDKNGNVQMIKGEMGEQGPPGPQGPVTTVVGQKGDRGDSGPRGFKGEPGSSLGSSKAMVFESSHDMMTADNLEVGTLLYVLETQTLWIQSTSGFTRLAASKTSDKKHRNNVDKFHIRG